MNYIAPEILLGEKPTFQNDVFALGSILYFMYLRSNMKVKREIHFRFTRNGRNCFENSTRRLQSVWLGVVEGEWGRKGFNSDVVGGGSAKKNNSKWGYKSLLVFYCQKLKTSFIIMINVSYLIILKHTQWKYLARLFKVKVTKEPSEP